MESKLAQTWHNLVRFVTTRSQLQVWQTHLANGDCSWHAYDQMTGGSACFGSEADMRIWIETQYYGK